MRCLYDVLGVESSCEDAAIRTAYRKLALQLHPDKNQADPVTAEERFKEVQNAYEILSDKHERAWYDAHKDAILRSGERHQAGAANEDMAGVRPDDYVDVYSYFTSGCYSGFGDGPRGFYGVYETVFSTLGEQEATAAAARADRRGSSTAPSRLPPFGLSNAPWSEVSVFYAEWSSFSTARDFSWAAEYNTASAPNRRVRRAMDQENEKKIKAARKEYNEGVRALVDFVKKRDKRVAAWQVEESKRRQEREAAAAAKREAERQERLERAARYQDAAWARDGTSEDDSSDDGDDDSFEEHVVWYCPVCDKHFKSEASLANHEKSKKHKEELELLRYSLKAEEAELAGAAGISLSSVVEEEEDTADERETESTDNLSSSEEQDEEYSSSSSSKEDERSDIKAEEESEEEEDDGIVDEDEMLASLINSRVSISRASEMEAEEEEDEEAEEKGVVETAAEEENDKESIGSALVGAEREVEVPVTEFLELGISSGDDDDNWGTKKAPKKKGKRGGKGGGGGAEKTSSKMVGLPKEQQPVGKKGGGGGGNSGRKAGRKTKEENEKALECSICKMEFPSRNQLFKHISQTGHAQLKEK